jgi:cytochrome c-type biogenesis protein CcmH|tara:strand:+ start:192 stop:566 length:375 start_codon:yes stop_codon:yes gene_type:complete
MRRYISIFLLINVFGIGTSVAMDGLTPEQEVLYQAIVQEVRCLVCQNQSIAESNAELAKDLRIEISSQIQEGKTEQEIKDFLLNRYGDFVLYQPSFNKKTFFLWLSPLILLFLIYGWYRKINLN